MQEPERIPLDPTTPRTHKPKSYPLKPISNENVDIDYYRPDNDSVYTPINNTKKYQIEEDFIVETNDTNIGQYYENIAKIDQIGLQ